MLRRSCSNAPGPMNRGFVATVCAFLIWGMLPLYLRPLREVSPVEIMCHRLLWCCVFVMIWLAARGQLREVADALRNPAVRWRLVATALLISLNWTVFVWAVQHGRVVEASLGYFINPLINVLLGIWVVGERLNRVQWSAVAIAAAGVTYLAWWSGAAPWIALALGISFSVYGLIRKLVAVDAVSGLATETVLLAPFAIGFVVWQWLSGQGAWGHASTFVNALLVAGGLITAIPLALFSYGARRIPYSTVGLIQYIGPSFQLTLGVLLYGEAFPASRAYGFVAIWAALALYAGDSLLRPSAAKVSPALVVSPLPTDAGEP
jgi:chloramphenicol-sensitive protein RarD